MSIEFCAGFILADAGWCRSQDEVGVLCVEKIPNVGTQPWQVVPRRAKPFITWSGFMPSFPHFRLAGWKNSIWYQYLFLLYISWLIRILDAPTYGIGSFWLCCTLSHPVVFLDKMHPCHSSMKVLSICHSVIDAI